MIKFAHSLLIVIVLLSCAAATSAAAPVSPGPASCGAMSQLLAAAPGGSDALAGILAAIPEPAAAPRSEPEFAMTYDVAPADRRIKAFAESARKAGELGASRLFVRLAEEGTPMEKLDFMRDNKKPYEFPARFRLARTAGVCRSIAKVFCTVSCINTGDGQRECLRDCETIIVDSCD